MSLWLSILPVACADPTKPPTDTSPASASTAIVADLTQTAKAAREKLLAFYLDSFPKFLASEEGLKLSDAERTRLLAQRLWIAEDDPTREIAMEELKRIVIAREITVDKSGGAAMNMPVAYFESKDEPIRDEYAMILAETGAATSGATPTGVTQLGDTPIFHFAFTALADWKVGELRKEEFTPQTIILCARFVPPEQSFTTLNGKPISLDHAMDALLAAKLPSDDLFMEADAWTVYALAAVHAKGYKQYALQFDQRLRAALDGTEKICASSKVRGDSAREIAGRLKLNSTILMALHRANENKSSIGNQFSEDRENLTRRLVDDAAIISSAPNNFQSPAVYEALPMTIRALGLEIPSNPTSTQP